MSFQRRCTLCGFNEFQLIKHVKYKNEFYRLIYCIGCKELTLEPLNPQRHPPKLTLCPDIVLPTGYCRVKNRRCIGVLDEEGVGISQ